MDEERAVGGLLEGAGELLSARLFAPEKPFLGVRLAQTARDQRDEGRRGVRAVLVQITCDRLAPAARLAHQQHR